MYSILLSISLKKSYKEKSLFLSPIPTLSSDASRVQGNFCIYLRSNIYTYNEGGHMTLAQKRATKKYLQSPKGKLTARVNVHQYLVKKKYPEAFQSGNIQSRELGKWITEQAGTACVYCGEAGVHVDHIYPLSLGGSHTWDNIQMICKVCNLAKNNQTEDQFKAWIKKVATKIELS